MRRWWRRIRGGGDALPDWAECLKTAGRLEAFESLVRKHFADRGESVELEDGWIVPAGGDRRYGLPNLAQACAVEPQSAWAGVIGQHFKRIERSNARQAEIEELLRDFDAVRERLVLRVWETEGVREMERTGADLVHAELAPGLSGMLMFDDDGAAVSVTREQAAPWGVETDELVRLALDNVARLEVATVPQQIVREGPPSRLRLFEGVSIYSAAMAMHAERIGGMCGVHGAMLSVPARSTFLTVPIDEARFIEAIGPMITLTHHLADEGPGEVSRRLWWVHKGRWLELPYSARKGKVEFSPPDEFNRMVAGLAQG